MIPGVTVVVEQRACWRDKEVFLFEESCYECSHGNNVCDGTMFSYWDRDSNPSPQIRSPTLKTTRYLPKSL